MQVNVTGRHGAVPNDVQEYAREKASKLDKFFDRIQKVDVVLDQHELEFTAEMAVHLVRGVSLVGKAKAEDQFKCIDQAEQLKLDSFYLEILVKAGYRTKKQVPDSEI